MRFHLGPIPEHSEFDVSLWTPLREPSALLFQLLALPISLLTLGVFGLLWFELTPLFRTVLTFPLPLAFLAAIPVQILVHELLHAGAHPRFGRTSQSVVGFWPSHVLFYAHYDALMTRNRFLMILVVPFFVLSVVPLIVAACLPIPCPLAAFISIFNATVSSGDLLGIGLLLFQIPANGLTQNQGWRTYWRLPTMAEAPDRRSVSSGS